MNVTKQINNYVIGYAKRHNTTIKDALKQEVVKNVIAWIRLRGEKK